ncbi:cation:proton antiporter, partial [Cyanobium sp. LEGE 06143]|nr:cation:proton antiporter [Cyanobium sp. LEGE 06143]
MGSVWINLAVLLAGVLLLLGIASSKFSARLGMPVLVLFLAVGMLAGSEGIGRIPFENYDLANSIGSVALALILFDGGLRTNRAALRRVWAPAGALATAGVVITALITGAAAKFILGLGWIEALLLGAIVGSTDAAAVFLLLHQRGLRLRPRVASTLEVESAVNDPMAIFLTLAFVGIATQGVVLD